MYRLTLGGIAKTAISSSLREALTPVACLGILNLGGTVALRADIPVSGEAGLGERFNVYDKANGDLWGRAEVIEVQETSFLCRPYDRVKPQFWEHIEERMHFSTSAPEVYLVRELPLEIRDVMYGLLDAWR